MNIVLEPYKMRLISYELKKESMDYYLFFMCMYGTGITGARLLNLKSEDLEEFIEESVEFLDEKLIEELRNHNSIKKVGDYIFQNRYDEGPLPRRTIEHKINCLGKELLNIDGFGFKTITKTFYYEYFRNNNYNFNVLKRLFSIRRQYMADLDSFLDYCGLTFEEYQRDSGRICNIVPKEFISNNISQLGILMAVYENEALSSIQKENIKKFIIEYISLLEPLIV